MWGNLFLSVWGRRGNFLSASAPPISGRGCRRNARGRKNRRKGRKDCNGNESKRSTRTRSVGGRIVLEQSDPAAAKAKSERRGGSTSAHFGRSRRSSDPEPALRAEGTPPSRPSIGRRPRRL